MPRPALTPIGRHLGRVARDVSRAFDSALAAAGGSLPAWLILISLKSGEAASQRQLAGDVGIRDATLTHHLAAMEAAGLLTRRRDPVNRRVQRVELTAAGEALFARLAAAAAAFDEQLRAGLSDADLQQARRLLDALHRNARTAGESG
jgi:MarR family transcriptional regulator, transcriptional regulator for hemolysin